ncbi:MAG: superfamily helicase, partial [Paenibacillus sp.]|nr:superfamily helicase [Paenibacillus sp.]
MNQMKNAVNQQAETRLTEEEIRYILHAADDIIASAGRTMLAKILKGSRDKKLLELELNDNIAY